MIEFFIYAIYGILSLATTIVVRKINWYRLTFVDGLLVGFIFFVSIPLALILYSGSFKAPDLFAAAYDPVLNLSTTLNLFIGWIFVLSFKLFWNHHATPNPIRNTDKTFASNRLLFDFRLLLVLYLFASFMAFYLSGKTDIGHWMSNSASAYKDSTLLIFTANIANVYRTIIFGFLSYLSLTNIFSKLQFLLYGIFIAVLDLALTFNRITVAYLFIAILIVFRKRILLILLFLIPILPTVTFLSQFWTSIRGSILNTGYSFVGLMNSIDSSLTSTLATGGAGGTIAANSSGVFETGNIQVFNYLVNNIPHQEEILWGWTFFLRPLAVFIPSTLWNGKPRTFGSIIGPHIQNYEVTLNSTMLGEVYGNFYTLWPVALFVMLSIALWCFKSLENKAPYIGHMAFFIAFALGRFEINLFIISIVAILMHLQLSRLLISLRKRTNY